MGEVDEAFVQALEHRPNPKFKEADGIPLIDLSALNDPESSKDPRVVASLVTQVGDACRDWGFFQVINHGIPTHVQQGIENAARKFFGLPLEEKRKIRRDEVNPMGYNDTELTKNVRDWKELIDLTVRVPTIMPLSHLPHDTRVQELRNRWPEFPTDFRVSCEEYVKSLEQLSYKLMELVSLSLGLPAKRFTSFFKEHTSIFRLNHYPPCPSPHLALGLGRHKDSGALTVLAQDDVGGLEVKRKSDGEWILVKPIPNSYIINVGAIIQVWSNDKYESVEHRVTVNSTRERFSIPFFFNPAHHLMVKPLDELVNEENPPKYKEYNWGKFFTTRKLGNFKNLGIENIQIHHFKISD